MIQPGGLAEAVPLRVAAAGDRDPRPVAVRCIRIARAVWLAHYRAAVDIVRRPRAVPVAQALAVVAQQRDAQKLLAHVHRDRLARRGVDELPLSRAIAVVQPRQHRHRRCGASAQIDRAAHRQRRLVGRARQVGQTGQRGEGRRVARVVALRPRRPERTGGDHHDVPALLAQRRVAQPQLVQRARAEVVDRPVGRRRQVADHLFRALLLQVELDRQLVEVELVEHRRLVDAAAKRAHRQRALAAVVDPRARLDLDHLRAQQRQQHRAVGTRPGPGEINDPPPRERAAVGDRLERDMSVGRAVAGHAITPARRACAGVQGAMCAATVSALCSPRRGAGPRLARGVSVQSAANCA